MTMDRVAGTAVALVALGALGGCTMTPSQPQGYELPGLDPQGGSPAFSVTPYYGYGSRYPGNYYYGAPGGYDYYGYGGGYYASNPYPYGYYGYPRYVVVPCPDNDSNGKCDPKPPKHDGDGGHGNSNGNGHHGHGQADGNGVPPAWLQPVPQPRRDGGAPRIYREPAEPKQPRGASQQPQLAPPPGASQPGADAVRATQPATTRAPAAPRMRDADGGSNQRRVPAPRNDVQLPAPPP